MKSSMKIGDRIEAELIARPSLKSSFAMNGIFEYECIDKDGELKWYEKIQNVCTDEGIERMLDVMFGGVGASDPWYIGLFSSDSTPATGWIYDDINTDQTEFTDYTGARQEFVESVAATLSIDNSGNAASFPITGSGTLYGGFLVNFATKDDHTATYRMFCASRFAASRTVANGDTVNVTWTLTGADT